MCLSKSYLLRPESFVNQTAQAALIKSMRLTAADMDSSPFLGEIALTILELS